MASKAQIIDFLLSGYRTNGTDVPLVLGTVEVYDAGTSNPSFVWDDRDKTLPTSTGMSTVTLDSYGRAEVYGDGLYKFIIKDATGATVETIDYYSSKSPSTTPSTGGIPTWDGLSYTVDTQSDLRAVTFQSIVERFVVLGRDARGDGGNGNYLWNPSDLSTEVSLFTGGGKYIAPDSDPTGASGAFVLQDRFVRPEVFGPKVTSTIQSVHDVLTDGGEVWLSGKYTTDSTVTITNPNIRFVGNHDQGSELENAWIESDGTKIFNVASYGTSFELITFSGDGGAGGFGATTVAIDITDTTDLLDTNLDTFVKNCFFLGCLNGVKMRSRNIKILDNVFTGCTIPTECATNDNPPDIRGIVINRNRYHSCGLRSGVTSKDESICIKIPTAANVRELFIDENYFDQCVTLMDIASASGSITNNKGFDLILGDALRIRRASDVWYVNDWRGLKVSDNIFGFYQKLVFGTPIPTESYGIHLIGSSPTTGPNYVDVFDNIILGPELNGIYCQAGDQIRIRENTIKNAGYTTNAESPILVGSGSGIVITERNNIYAESGKSGALYAIESYNENTPIFRDNFVRMVNASFVKPVEARSGAFYVDSGTLDVNNLYSTAIVSDENSLDELSGPCRPGSLVLNGKNDLAKTLGGWICAFISTLTTTATASSGTDVLTFSSTGGLSVGDVVFVKQDDGTMLTALIASISTPTITLNKTLTADSTSGSTVYVNSMKEITVS